MCVFYSAGFIMAWAMIWLPFWSGVAHAVGLGAYIIMAPIVGVRMYDEMEVNRINVELLANFEVINECADKYTNVDSDLVT